MSGDIKSLGSGAGSATPSRRVRSLSKIFHFHKNNAEKIQVIYKIMKKMIFNFNIDQRKVEHHPLCGYRNSEIA